ncbi:hypothetical protein EX30DRAFT_341299 [Ascodesmis nigricans]|uniref:TRP C-terminal domain-containing protein n=1 Tax=Ascodesmis nigricans TaxID=341454 RepID=A0A4S2MVT5_9PEZI|nr:hypothetical protein EX30DRAFT_341299 [Ascodesmis nigricans]
MAPPPSASSSDTSSRASSIRSRDATSVFLPSADSRGTRALRCKRRASPPSSILRPAALLVALLSAASIIPCTSAALISKFRNCLSDSEQTNPTRVQFHPVLVAAEYQSLSKDENFLRTTVWGIVTGSDIDNPPGTTPKLGKRSLGGLNHWDTSELGSPTLDVTDMGWRRDMWHQKREETGTQNPQASTNYSGDTFRIGSRWPNTESIRYNFTAEIVDYADAWLPDKKDLRSRTAVLTKVMLSSFEVIGRQDPFCLNEDGDEDSSIMRSGCPMGNLLEFADLSNTDNWEEMKNRRIPANETQRNDVEYLKAQLPSFTFYQELPSGYQFTSLGVHMRIKAGDNPAQTTLGCIHFEVTPALNQATSDAIRWFAVATLVTVGISCIVAAISNPWSGTTDLFKWSTNYGMDHDMLRLVTPGFGDCLNWLQFITLTGALSLDYPGYYQAVVSKLAWSCLLLEVNFYSGNGKTPDYWVHDGLLVVQAWKKGFERLGQAVGLTTVNDIWVSVAVWFWIVTIAVITIFQIWFWTRRMYRKVMKIEEGDLSSRNLPFTYGMLNRITFTWFLMPLLATSLFQLVVANESDTDLVIVAAVSVFLLISSALLIVYLIQRHRPRQGLWDNLPTLLRFGTFYNTLQETELRFFAVQLASNVARAIIIGALQHSGVAQISVLIAIEIAMMLAVLGLQPYHPETSMNLIHFIFCVIRLITIILQLAFIPSLKTSDAVKGWAGWIILGLHGVTLAFLFLFKALQTLLEMALRGYRGDEEASRGGIVKIFGMRQLHRRKRNANAEHRSSPLTPTPMAGAERKRATLTTMSSHNRQSHSNSSAGLLHSPTTTGEHQMSLVIGPEGSQSGHGHSASGSTAAGFTPTSPAPSGYGYLPTQDYDTPHAGPYYRPPRTRRMTDGEQYPAPLVTRQSWASAAATSRKTRNSTASIQAASPSDPTNESEFGDSPAAAVALRQTDPSMATLGSNPGNTDYAVRESDFYYGVRGPALNTQPVRRLGTGPADPTGPISTAKSWIKQKLGIAKGKEERGFSVVRSSRAPEQMLAAQRELELENSREQGRGGNSDDDDEDGRIGIAVTSQTPEPRMSHVAADTDSDSSDEEVGPESRMLDQTSNNGPAEATLSRKPTVPRKSSKRKSKNVSSGSRGLYDPPVDRSSGGSRLQLPLPFADNPNKKKDERELSFSSTVSSILNNPPGLESTDRPASVGEVRGGKVGQVVSNNHSELRGSQAELVRGGSNGSTATPEKGQ